MLPMVRRHSQDEDVIISVMNDGFLKVFKKINQYSGAGSLEGWIRRIIFHAISDYFKLQRNKVRYLDIDEQSTELVTKASKELEYQDLISLVQRLPEKEEQVFNLFAIYGYKHSEISTMLDINTNTSKWYLTKAREKLKSMILKQNTITKHA